MMTMPRVFGLLATVILVSACEVPEPEVEEVVRPVRYMRVQPSGAGETRIFSGVTKAAVETDLSFKVSGLVTALDISPLWHVRMQAAFQKHTDNGVSKTVNLPHDATLRDVRDAYLLAHKLKCKGITVYRYGSRQEQTLYTGSATTRASGRSLTDAPGDAGEE